MHKIYIAAVTSFLAGLVWSGDVSLDTDLVIDGSVYTNLTDNFSGTGGICVTGGGTATIRRVAFSGYLTKNITDAGAFTITNAYFLDVVPVSAIANGGSMIPGTYQFIGHRVDHNTKDYQYSTFEYQFNEGSSIKTVSARIWQAGTNVVVTYGNSQGAQYLQCRPVTNEETKVVTPATTVAANMLGVINYHEWNSSSLTPSPYADYASKASTEGYATSKTTGNYGIVDPVFEVTNRNLSMVRGYTTTTEETVARNASYLTVRPVVGYARGVSMSNTAAWGKPMTFCHRREKANEKYTEWQAQMSEGSTVKCIMLRIYQQGDDVVAKAVQSDGSICYYKNFSSSEEAAAQVGVWDPLVNMAGRQTMALCKSDSDGGGYGMTNLIYSCDTSSVRLNGVNTFTGDVTVDGGVLVVDGQGTSLPAGCNVVVTNGATLALDATGCDQWQSLSANILVASNSTLKLIGSWNTGITGWLKATIDGGTFDCWCSANYMANFLLRNGATLSSPAYWDGWVRTGGTRWSGETHSFIKSEGALTNLISASLQMYHNGGDDFLSFDCDAPLLMTGILGLNGDGTSYTLHRLYKRGTEPLILRGGQATNWAEWRLLEGTVRLEADNQLWVSNSLYLAGGDLFCGAGTSNAVLALSVNASAQTLDKWQVAASSGGSITFGADSRLVAAGKGTAWPTIGVNRIILQGELSNGNFRIGENRCLADYEVRAFRYVDGDGRKFKVRQDADGYILPGDQEAGTVIFVR